MSRRLLVDSSIWADLFAGRVASGSFESAVIHTHEFVIGELLLATLRRGHPAVRMLSLLPKVAMRPHEEVVALVWEHRLEGCGIGWVDAHLLASAAASGVALRTRDRSLLKAAARVGVAAE